MGDYTKCGIDLKLKRDVRTEVVAFLKWLIEDGWPSTHCAIMGELKSSAEHDKNPPFPDDHPYFKGAGYHKVASDYTQRGRDKPDYRPSKIEQVDGQWVVRIYSDIKNYNDEIEQFNDWVAQYCELEEGSVIGEYKSDASAYDDAYTVKVVNGKIVKLPPTETEERYGGFYG